MNRTGANEYDAYHEYKLVHMVLYDMHSKYLSLDTNGDGTITNEEFRHVLEEMIGEGVLTYV